MKTVIFKVEYGGLGDHLFYSALPRLLKEQGLADQVFLSKQSVYRNPQIFDLVWKNNPFVDGLSDEALTPAPEIVNSTQTKVMNRIYERFGLVSATEFEPEVYGQIPVHFAFAHPCIDLNYISYIGAVSMWDKWQILKRYPQHILVNPEPWMTRVFPGRASITTSSLMEYVSVVKSATDFVTVASGGATLAAALKKPSTVYFGFAQNPMFHHGMHHYIQVGGSHFFRRKLAKHYRKRNERRLKQAKTQ